MEIFRRTQIATELSDLCQTSIHNIPLGLNFSNFFKKIAVEISGGNTCHPDILCQKGFKIWGLGMLGWPGNFWGARNFYENFIFREKII